MPYHRPDTSELDMRSLYHRPDTSELKRHLQPQELLR
jgi:hypothetical protein